MKMPRFVNELAEAVGFVTRFPLPRFLFNDNPAGAKAAWAFPLAGAIAAIIPALLLCTLIHLGASPLLSALLSLLSYILITGGLHEDGLADACDGLFGGKNREDVLTIMKDSRSGSYGILALFFSIGIRATAIAELAQTSGVHAALMLMISAIIARTVMIGHWHFLPAARANGAAACLGRPQRINAIIAVVVGLLCSGSVAIFIGAAVSSALSVILALLSVLCFSLFVKRRIGGHTGDTLGASVQIGEMSMLAALAISV